MKYSDEQQQHISESEINAPVESDRVSASSDGASMPKIVPKPDRAPQPERADAEAESLPERRGGDEIIGILFKTLFLTLSLIAIFACILAVSFPLGTMRIFNDLGMSERAVDFAERYIDGQIDKYDASATDEYGGYVRIAATPQLTNDDFIEALYVATSLSEKLMDAGYAAGDKARGDYYAERLVKYTAMYLSLNNVATVSLAKDAQNMASMPLPSLRHVVYSYEYDMRTSNFRARSYLGRTDAMVYNTRINNGAIYSAVNTVINSFLGQIPDGDNARAAALDNFTDFVGQLSEYLDVEFLRLGVENDLTKRYGVHEGNNYYPNVPVVSETFVKNSYVDKLNGNEFTMLIMGLNSVTPSSNGFTALYSGLKQCFPIYAQWAVDLTPADTNGENSGRLRQLHWLRNIQAAAIKLWYMEMLLYYNSENLGLNRQAVLDEYGTCRGFSLVTYDSRQYQLSEVYNIKLAQYVAQYQ